MLCHVDQRKFSDLTASLEASAFQNHLPYMGTFELTYRCNQACRHCYCNLALNDTRRRDELTTTEAQRVLDELAEAGCLWLLLSGGEVLVRNDFADIYLYALRKGIFVAVLTNATLIDEKTARLFADYPPLEIDISVYGSNAAIHDAVTGVPGSFDRMLRGISRLRRFGVGFSLKTVLMTLNRRDLDGMRALADGMGAPFRYDCLIIPRLDGNRAPTAYRLSASDIAALELTGEREFTENRETFDGLWKKDPAGLVSCGAGVFSFNIDPYGTVSPCTMFSSFRRSLRRSTFREAWSRVAAEYAATHAEMTPAECRACAMLFICPNCPAWAELETKRFDTKVTYLCEYAKCLEKGYFLKKEEAMQ